MSVGSSFMGDKDGVAVKKGQKFVKIGISQRDGLYRVLAFL